MTFDWRQYLYLARSLPGQQSAEYSQEAAERCAVSRAYYAAFCHARGYAQARLGFISTGIGLDHALLRQHYKSRGRYDIEWRLKRLHQWRISCDYENSVQNLTNTYTQAIALSTYIINKL